MVLSSAVPIEPPSCCPLGPGQEHPLQTFPAYTELLETFGSWRAVPPAVEHMTVLGSHQLF
jgi:hypothetical protein